MGEPLDFNNLKMLFPFLDESPNFASGFECGKIYGQMLTTAPKVEAIIHLKNWEQLKLIVESTNYQITKCDFLEDDLIEVEFVTADSGTKEQ